MASSPNAHQWFENVARGAMSPDNNVRQRAEAGFEQAKQQPDRFFAMLLQAMCNSKDLAVRQFSAVMLRQVLSLSNPLWSKVGKMMQEKVKEAFLHLLKTEANGIMRRKTTDVIGVLAAKVFSSKDDKWSALLPAVMALAASQHAQHRISVCRVLGAIGEYHINLLKPQMGQVVQVLLAPLGNYSTSSSSNVDSDVYIEAVRGLTSVLVSLTGKEQGQLQQAVLPVFQLVSRVSQAPKQQRDEELLAGLLQAAMDFATRLPKMLRNSLQPVVDCMAAVAGDNAQQAQNRRYAMEFLNSLATRGGGMVRKAKGFAPKVVPLAFQFMLELEHDDDAWGKGTEETDMECEGYSVGVESIDRLACALGAKVFMPVADPIVLKLLQSPEWKHRHAAVMAISEMCDGCKKAVKTQMQRIVDRVLPFITRQGEHQRVVYAAVNCLAQLAEDFAPKFQKDFHQVVLPAFVTAMDSSKYCSRVLRHAALACVDFSRDVGATGKQVMLPHLKAVLSALQKLLLSRDLRLQEAACNAVSATIIVTEKEFVPYYQIFMPIAAKILQSATHKTQRQLRGNAIEMLGLLAECVGAERFAQDPLSKPLLQALLQMHAQGLPADDPQAPHLAQALSRMCACLGPRFVPYLSQIVPKLLQSAAIEGACEIKPVEGEYVETREEGVESYPMPIRGGGILRVSIRTAQLEEKITACQMLFQYATTLKEHFFPYVAEVARIMVPLCRYPHEAIRECAMASLPALLIVASHYVQGQQDRSPNVVVQMFGAMQQHILDSIKKEFQLTQLCAILEVLAEVLVIVYETGLNKGPAPLVTQQQVEAVMETLASIVKEADERRRERDKLKSEPDFDEEEADALAAQNDSEDEALSYVHMVINAVMKAGGGMCIPFFMKHCHDIFWSMLSPQAFSFAGGGYTTTGLCVFDDVIAYGGTNARQLTNKFYPLCLQHATHENPDIRQSAVFGVGVCAEALGVAFKTANDAALTALCKAILAPNARSEEYAEATDNAISSVGKVCEFCFGDQEPVFQNTRRFSTPTSMFKQS